MPGDPRIEPLSVKVLLTSGEGVAIDWRDSHQSRYTFPYLREKCPCATCRTAAPSAQPPGPFPMYKPAPRLTGAEAVGRYAVQLLWADGHNTGLYSFDYLRDICPCPQCAAGS